MGKDFYLWGEIFPGCLGAREEWSDLAITSYERAIKAIKAGHLLIQKSHEHDPLDYIYEYGREVPVGGCTSYIVKFGDFFDWAIKTHLFIASEFANALGICQETKFSSVIETHVKIQAAMKAYWYYFQIPISKMKEKIGKWIPKGFGSHNTIRELAKEIDPWQEERGLKRSQTILPLDKPRNAISIPKVFSVCSSGVQEKNFALVRICCQVISNVLIDVNRNIKISDIESHSLILMYLRGSPSFINEVLLNMIRSDFLRLSKI